MLSTTRWIGQVPVLNHGRLIKEKVLHSLQRNCTRGLFELAGLRQNKMPLLVHRR